MPIRVIEPPPTSTGRIRIIEPAPASKPRRSMVDNVTGYVTGVMANVNRGTGLLDEAAAKVDSMVTLGGDFLSGRRRLDPKNLRGSLKAAEREAFDASMAKQRGVEDSFREAYPKTAAFAQGFGNALPVFIPAGETTNAFAQAPRAMNMVRGAVTAGLTSAGYAAVDRGTPQERLKAASDASWNPVTLTLGAAGGALAPAARRAPKPLSQPRADAATLADIGVTTTIPQRMGRGIKATEDLVSRAPIIGITKAGLQDRQLEQLNRGVALKALQPVGLGIPKEIKPGFEMVEYVDGKLGGVYDKAAALAPRVDVGAGLTQDMARIAGRRVDLAESEARLFDSAIQDRMTRLENGVPSGKMVKEIQSELGGLQAEAARKGQTTLSSMFGDARKALMDAIGRSSPQAGALIKRADKGWAVYSVMNDAAAAASNRGGIWLPGQLNTQSRASAKAIGSNMAGKGKGTLQDIATAASRLLPDSYGNPGTANALGWGALGTQYLYDPAGAAVTATALTAAATPYFLMGRKIIEQLPENASRSQLQAASQELARLAAKDPAVTALRSRVAARLSAAAGVAGAQAYAPNAFARPAPPAR